MTTCALTWTKSGSRIYIVDGREVDEWTYAKGVAKEAAEQRKARVPQGGKRFRAPGVAGDRGDWSRERDRKTGGDGRYAPQLARFPGDRKAVFPSKRAMLEAAKKRGMEEDRS